MAILTINHYINQANSFITDIRNNRNGYYMFAARPQPWANSSGGNDDTAVISANNSVSQNEQTVYDDILYGKLLTDSDVTHLVPRYDWVANTVYDVYDQTDANLYTKQFYVVTDKYEVYKCIDNNNGVVSYVKPTLTSASGTFKTGDGYVWKYMYSIDATSNSKFTTANYIPVSTNAAVQGNATPGSIDVIKITDGGNSYFVYETGYIGGMVNKYTIQLPSTSSNTDDYYTNSSIYLKSGFGAGQIREISSSNGTSKQISVSTPFDIYTRLDLANVSGTVATGYYVEQPYDDINYLYAHGYFNIDGTVTQSDTGASGKVVASNTSVIQVSRYDTNTAFSLGYPIVDTSQSGSLKAGTISVGNTGACNLAFVTYAGTGYAANATVTVTANGSGSGAVVNAQSNATGKITAVKVQTPGTQYFVAPTLTISAPTAQTFNANTAVTGGTGSGSNNIIALATASYFVANDLITYTVAAGNTAVGGLTSGTTYYVDFANATVVALKATATGSRIALTKGPTQTGHTLQGKTATAIMYCDNQLVYGTGTRLNDAAFNINANTAGVSNTADTLLISSANSFISVGDRVYYGVPTGNTAIPNLTGNTYYYVTFSNSSAIALSSTAGGANVNIAETRTAASPQVHTITGNNAGYANGDYIRVGANTVSNIRRVANNVNTTVLAVTAPFSTTFSASANVHYNMPVAAEPVSIVVNGANGYISNTNLTSLQIAITNSALSGVYFSVGEKVNMTDDSLVNQGANGIVAYANTTTAILSSVSGSWVANSGGTQFYVSGESSLQLSQIESVESNPNITINDPTGTFKLGYPIFFKTTAGGSASGNATLVAKITLPNDQTEYEIGPTVSITGDGSNASAIAVVNTAANSNYDVVGIDIVNPGIGYTQANVTIYANTNYGTGATARAIISPVFGHGYDAVTELGGRYVGVDAKFDTISNESYEILGYGKYRKVGILQNPQFKDLKVTLTDFDRVNFTLNTSSYSTTLGWTPGEMVLQSTTNAAGVVVYGNSSFLQLKSVKGTFNVSNTIYGYYSDSSANVNVANTIYFPVGNSAEIITQSNSGSIGIITSVVNNTVYFMSNVVGQFADGDVMYDSVVNAYATVDTIYTANGTKDVSSSFGNRFNQTARITLTANTGEFYDNEYVQQEVSLASGRIISSTNEKDLVVTSMSGSFTVGQTVTDTTTNANGICIFANTTYLKLTAVSQSLSFGTSHTINNGLGSTATISAVYPVLVLNDVSDVSNFQAGSNAIIGQTTGASGTCNSYLLIKNPDLVRDSGKLIYSESFTPVTRSATSIEEVKLVIKF